VVEASVKVVGRLKQAVSAEYCARGASLMVTAMVVESIHPVILVTIRFTLNVPPAEKACVGFCMVEVLLVPEAGSPKFQLQAMMAPPPFCCERSVNWRPTCAHPPEVKEKLATGA
jgi:hypothetical protein